MSWWERLFGRKTFSVELLPNGIVQRFADRTVVAVRKSMVDGAIEEAARGGTLASYHIFALTGASQLAGLNKEETFRLIDHPDFEKMVTCHENAAEIIEGVNDPSWKTPAYVVTLPVRNKGFRAPQVDVDEAISTRQTTQKEPANAAMNFPKAVPNLLATTATKQTFKKKNEHNGKIVIPSGKFIMGSKEDQVMTFFNKCNSLDKRLAWFDAETPQRTIFLDEIIIDKYPVTCEKYSRFCSETNYPRPEYWKGLNPPDNIVKHPVVYISLNDAKQYAKWAGGRLPYESEWEKASRGHDGRLYPWGNEWDPTKSNSNNPEHRTTPVDSYPQGASPYGAIDTVGNVKEWTQDIHLPYPGHIEKQLKEDSASMSIEYMIDSRDGKVGVNPAFTTQAVVRGGSFCTLIAFCRCAARLYIECNAKMADIGFRCVYSPNPHAKLGDSLKKRDIKQAVKFAEKALNVSPMHLAILFDAAIAFQRDGQIKRAVGLLETCIKIDPNDNDARRLLNGLR